MREKLNWIFITILLGASGSGTWETIIKPVWEWFSGMFVKFTTLFGGSYVDYLHSDIGMGSGKESMSVFGFIYIVIMAFSLLHLFHVLEKMPTIFPTQVRPPVDRPTPSKRGIFTLPNFHSILAGLANVLLMVVVTALFVKSYYHNNAVVFVERSIEILSPYITPEERLKLRSEYRAVDNADKFRKLYENIIEKSKKHQEEMGKNDGIQIPTFNSLAK